MSSALGIWLLLAACASVPPGPDRAVLEEALGCSVAQTADLVERFFDAPPKALRTAMALWVRSVDRTTSLIEWSGTLPATIERGPIPSQEEGDAWVRRKTDGRIASVPIELSALSRLVLVSALATKVSWREGFAVEPAPTHLRPSSVWQGQVTKVLVDYQQNPLTMLAETEAAGVVAAHFAEAAEDLGVLSVAAAPIASRQQVFEAAHELAERCRTETLAAARRSLFDLPVGNGHSWHITEEVVAAYREGWCEEDIEYTVLPAWTCEGELDLRASPLFGAGSALAVLLGLIGSSLEGDVTEAKQSAIARFTPKGFDAAGASSLGIVLGETSNQPPTHSGLGRRANLYFDHPYAAVALAGTSSDFSRGRTGHTDSFCLPLFDAWIETPTEPEAFG